MNNDRTELLRGLFSDRGSSGSTAGCGSASSMASRLARWLPRSIRGFSNMR
jgi:hypothetical protein